MDKMIIFQGKQNRYQMKKMLHQIIPVEKTNIGIEECYFDYDYQKKSLDEDNNCFRLMRQHINRKLESYKNQDNLKNRKTDIFVDLDYVIKMFKDGMKCNYCSNNIFILYKMRRDPSQWTLDRINNDLAHEKGNVILACLKCNLERRCVDKDKFTFTKKLIIVKNTQVL